MHLAQKRGVLMSFCSIVKAVILLLEHKILDPANRHPVGPTKLVIWVGSKLSNVSIEVVKMLSWYDRCPRSGCQTKLWDICLCFLVLPGSSSRDPGGDPPKSSSISSRLHCRLVCHQWKDVADRQSFWSERCRRVLYPQCFVFFSKIQEQNIRSHNSS